MMTQFKLFKASASLLAAPLLIVLGQAPVSAQTSSRPSESAVGSAASGGAAGAGAAGSGVNNGASAVGISAAQPIVVTGSSDDEPNQSNQNRSSSSSGTSGAASGSAAGSSSAAGAGAAGVGIGPLTTVGVLGARAASGVIAIGAGGEDDDEYPDLAPQERFLRLALYNKRTSQTPESSQVPQASIENLIKNQERFAQFLTDDAFARSWITRNIPQPIQAGGGTTTPPSSVVPGSGGTIVPPGNGGRPVVGGGGAPVLGSGGGVLPGSGGNPPANGGDVAVKPGDDWGDIKGPIIQPPLPIFLPGLGS